MKRIVPILTLCFWIFDLCMNAQPMPPKPKLIVRFSSYKVIGNTLQIVVDTNKLARVPAPPRTNFTLSVSSPGMIRVSHDGLKWCDYGFCWSNLPVANDFSTVGIFKEQVEVEITLKNSISYGVTNNRITEFCQHSPLGCTNFDIGLQNDVWLPVISDDCTNYFVASCMSSNGFTSGNSVPVGCKPGKRTIKIQ